MLFGTLSSMFLISGLHRSGHGAFQHVVPLSLIPYLHDLSVLFYAQDFSFSPLSVVGILLFPHSCSQQVHHRDGLLRGQCCFLPIQTETELGGAFEAGDVILYA